MIKQNIGVWIIEDVERVLLKDDLVVRHEIGGK